MPQAPQKKEPEIYTLLDRSTDPPTEVQFRWHGIEPPTQADIPAILKANAESYGPDRGPRIGPEVSRYGGYTGLANLGHDALKQLPTIGALIGSVAGGPAAPITGPAIGAATGAGLNLLRTRPASVTDAAMQFYGDLLPQLLLDLAGQGIVKLAHPTMRWALGMTKAANREFEDAAEVALKENVFPGLTSDKTIAARSAATHAEKLDELKAATAAGAPGVAPSVLTTSQVPLLNKAHVRATTGLKSEAPKIVDRIRDIKRQWSRAGTPAVPAVPPTPVQYTTTGRAVPNPVVQAIEQGDILDTQDLLLATPAYAATDRATLDRARELGNLANVVPPRLFGEASPDLGRVTFGGAPGIPGTKAGPRVSQNIPLLFAEKQKGELDELADALFRQAEAGGDITDLPGLGNREMANAIRAEIEQQAPAVIPLNRVNRARIGIEQALKDIKDKPETATPWLIGAGVGGATGYGSGDWTTGAAGFLGPRALMSPTVRGLAAHGLKHGGAISPTAIRSFLLAALMGEDNEPPQP